MGFLDALFGTQPKDEVQERQQFSVSDPAFAEWLRDRGFDVGEVNAERALGIPAYWRGVNLIAGTIAGLPLKTYRDKPDETRERVKSFLDKPGGPYPVTAFAWKELVMLHLLTGGETFLLHVNNGAGALIGLWPIPASAVSKVEWVGANKLFHVSMADGSTHVYNSTQMTQVMGLSLDGTRGLSPLTLFRLTVKLGISTEKAAYRIATSGLSITGLVTPDEDMSAEEAKELKEDLDVKVLGPEVAGGIALINRQLKFTPWSMTSADAEFLASREFNVTDWARILGVPPHLLAQTEKVTSWGTGVAEQNLGLARYTLQPWTSRLEEVLSELLPNPRFCEFDFKGLLQGTPAEEIELLKLQIDAGIIDVEEARKILNLPPRPTPAAPAVDDALPDEDAA